MDDVGSILAEAAAEVQMRSPRGEGRAQSASGALAAEVFGEMAESKGSDERHRRDERLGGQPLSGMDMLKRAANTVAEEEQHDSAQAFKAAGLTVRKSMDDEYDQTFEDEKIDVEEVLGRISEDIHNNKIEYSGADIDKALMEAAEDLERDQPRDPPSSPDASDDDEPGDEARNRELIIAVAQGDEKNVRWLLSHGASYCCSDMHGWTPLHWAASKGNEDMIALLLDAAGNERLKKFVNRPDALSGWTPLHVRV